MADTDVLATLKLAHAILADLQGMFCECPDDSGSCDTCVLIYPVLALIDKAIAAQKEGVA